MIFLHSMAYLSYPPSLSEINLNLRDSPIALWLTVGSQSKSA